MGSGCNPCPEFVHQNEAVNIYESCEDGCISNFMAAAAPFRSGPLEGTGYNRKEMFETHARLSYLALAEGMKVEARGLDLAEALEEKTRNPGEEADTDALAEFQAGNVHWSVWVGGCYDDDLKSFEQTRNRMCRSGTFDDWSDWSGSEGYEYETCQECFEGFTQTYELPPPQESGILRGDVFYVSTGAHHPPKEHHPPRRYEDLKNLVCTPCGWHEYAAVGRAVKCEPCFVPEQCADTTLEKGRWNEALGEWVGSGDNERRREGLGAFHSVPRIPCNAKTGYGFDWEPLGESAPCVQKLWGPVNHQLDPCDESEYCEAHAAVCKKDDNRSIPQYAPAPCPELSAGGVNEAQGCNHQRGKFLYSSSNRLVAMVPRQRTVTCGAGPSERRAFEPRYQYFFFTLKSRSDGMPAPDLSFCPSELLFGSVWWDTNTFEVRCQVSLPGPLRNEHLLVAA